MGQLGRTSIFRTLPYAMNENGSGDVSIRLVHCGKIFHPDALKTSSSTAFTFVLGHLNKGFFSGGIKKRLPGGKMARLRDGNTRLFACTNVGGLNLPMLV